ncbi:MAG: GGDEF domain-containing protein [bacterium]|nr:GGDEF domain-containing protein [bacterium]
MTTETWFWIGGRQAVAAALTKLFGGPPAGSDAGAVAPGDLLVVDACAAGAELPADLPGGGHAFGAVRALKQQGLRVAVVVNEDDALGVQLARFCLADAVLPFDVAAGAVDGGELDAGRARAAGGKRPSVDALLQRLEQEFAQSVGRESAVARLLRFESENPALQTLQDPDTGLFDGPYATWKLDEEWKRSKRFHQPLSLVLLDLGDGIGGLGEADRKAVLADAASVFLNECRDIDVLSRFTPSTFLFLLPGTGLDGAEILAQRMIEGLRQRLPAGMVGGLAAGIATAPHTEIPDRKAFLTVAEACLQRARSAGGGGQVATTWQ